MTTVDTRCAARRSAANPDLPRMVAAGETFDVVEVSAAIGEAALSLLRTRGVRPGTVILDRRRHTVGFLVPPRHEGAGRRLRELPRRHGAGVWITFPPSPCPSDAAVAWLVAPDRGTLRTMSDQQLQSAIADTVRESTASNTGGVARDGCRDTSVATRQCE